MDDPFPMCFGKCVRQLDRVRDRLIERQRAGCQAIGQRSAVDKFQHQILNSVLIADIVQRADVWMIQRRDRLRFALKAATRVGIGRDVGRKDLDRHGAIEPRVARLVDLPHPARPDRRDDLVRPQAGTGGDGHFCSVMSQMSPSLRRICR